MSIPIPISQAILIILVVAVCTFLTRSLPFALFGGKRQLPGTITYLGMVLPGTVMAILVVYCLKNISFVAPSNWLPALISVALVAALHIYKRNNFLSIGAGTVCYMLLVQKVFV